MAETNLKEALRDTYTAGLLAEKKLEIQKDDKGNDKAISGTITIQTSDVNFTTYRVYTNKYKKDGNENKAYKGLVTIMNEYKSVAEVGKEEADWITTKGKVQPNSYKGEQGIVELMQFSSSFFSRVTKEKIEDNIASNFSVEVYIKAIRSEVVTSGEDAGEPTGRAIIDGYLALYGGGIEPIQLIAPEEDGIAEAVMDTFNPGETVMFDGEIQNTRVETVKEIPMAIGKPKIERKVDFKNELIITGASEAYEEERAYSAEVIQAALAVREEKLNEKKSGSTSTTKKPAASGRKAGWM